MTRKGLPAWCLALGLMLLALPPQPADAGRDTANLEATMVVTGRITIERDGRASAWELDHRRRLPPEVAALVDEDLHEWRFAPVLVDGQAVRGSARMRLLLKARPLPDGDFGAAIVAARFGREAVERDEEDAGRSDRRDESPVVTAIDMKPPLYPRQASAAKAWGRVYLVLRIDRQGRVDEAMVQQVNLSKPAGPDRMARMRQVLGEASLDAARGWKFQPPTTGDLVDEPYWTVRVPIDFHPPVRLVSYVDIQDHANYYVGRWNVYVPGPVTQVPWKLDPAEARRLPHTLASGMIDTDGARDFITLLTPLGEG